MDRGAYLAILALALLLSAAAVALGGTIAIRRTKSFPAPHDSAWRQTASSQSSAAQQSTSTQQSICPQTQGGTQKNDDDHQPDSAMHCITVTFDYDFTKTPACSAKLTTACVQTFNVYDISGDKPHFLFAVPVPQNAQGVVKGITGTSPRLLFAVGRHRIGVSAREPNGDQSPPRACKVIVEIKPDSSSNPLSPPVSH